MRAGIILPGGDANEQLELALVAEQSGWDGVFVWEASYGIDAWGLLSAIAVRTSHVRLGTVLTPPPAFRDGRGKVASQVATLDQLSGGRAIVTVGLGALTDDLPETGGEPIDLRERADLLDDGIGCHALARDGSTISAARSTTSGSRVATSSTSRVPCRSECRVGSWRSGRG